MMSSEGSYQVLTQQKEEEGRNFQGEAAPILKVIFSFLVVMLGGPALYGQSLPPGEEPHTPRT